MWSFVALLRPLLRTRMLLLTFGSWCRCRRGGWLTHWLMHFRRRTLHMLLRSFRTLRWRTVLVFLTVGACLLYRRCRRGRSGRAGRLQLLRLVLLRRLLLRGRRHHGCGLRWAVITVIAAILLTFRLLL